MLPNVGTDTLKICWYAGEVVGRARGIASMDILVPDLTRRTAINDSANRIHAAIQALTGAYVARVTHEFVGQRIALGQGRGVDRGFDALVSWASETARTSLPDRSVRNPEYRTIFPDGAEAYSTPTIKEDEQLADDLKQAILASKIPVKAEMVSRVDAAIPTVTAAASGLRDAEKQVNTLFQAEIAARKGVIDALWDERKAIELALGRGGRQLARFVYFDPRKPNGEAAKTDEAKPADGEADEGEAETEGEAEGDAKTDAKADDADDTDAEGTEGTGGTTPVLKPVPKPAPKPADPK